jgi:hypothetical protein
LSATGQFVGTHIADRITLLVLYMPLVRREIEGYTEVWNCHHIRKQKQRPNAVTGQPKVLYHWPPAGVTQYGRAVDQSLANEILSECKDWGKKSLH